MWLGMVSYNHIQLYWYVFFPNKWSKLMGRPVIETFFLGFEHTLHAFYLGSFERVMRPNRSLFMMQDMDLGSGKWHFY